MDARISTSGLTASANAPAKAGASPPPGIAPRSYAISGKIMLSAIVSLLAVVVIVLCLHIYSRWYFLRLARRRRLARAFARRAAATAGGAGGGLEPDLIKSLPVFTYSPEQGKAEPGSTSPPPPECAVCLCDFEKRDQGRVLPACAHVFHAECIDLWFQTHSTCPLCRAPVQRIAANEKLDPADGRCGEEGANKSAGTPASTSSSASGSPDSTSSMARCLPDLDFRAVRADRNLHVDLERGEAVPEPTPTTANRTASKTRTSSS